MCHRPKCRKCTNYCEFGGNTEPKNRQALRLISRRWEKFPMRTDHGNPAEGQACRLRQYGLEAVHGALAGVRLGGASHEPRCHGMGFDELPNDAGRGVRIRPRFVPTEGRW
jgi:hypothetical protein